MNKPTTSSSITPPAATPTEIPPVPSNSARDDEQSRKKELMQYYTTLGLAQWQNQWHPVLNSRSGLNKMKEEKKVTTNAEIAGKTSSTESSSSSSASNQSTAPNLDDKVEDLVFRPPEQPENNVLSSVRRFFN